MRLTTSGTSIDVGRVMQRARRLWYRLGALKARVRIAFYNFGYRVYPTHDGIPLPPPKLVNMVIGTRELAWYQLGGLFMHQAIVTFLQRNGISIESSPTILEFGCGCGRILRWWRGLSDRCEIWGCDYNPKLVAWCRTHLSSVARFKVNGPDPPLDFPDEKFAFIYSYSVFTHFSADRQKPWMQELGTGAQAGRDASRHGVRQARCVGESASGPNSSRKSRSKASSYSAVKRAGATIAAHITPKAI